MPGKLAKSTFSLSDLPICIPKIFDQVQVSTSNHQKNFVALYKLQLESAKHVEESKKGTKLIGEYAFWDICFKMVVCILPVKRGPTVVDRVVKFLGGYIKFINEKGGHCPVLRSRSLLIHRAAAEENAPTMVNNEDSEGNTTVTRFIARLLDRLLHGFQAKDKTIRHRAVQLVAEMVANLGEIESVSDNLFLLSPTDILLVKIYTSRSGLH
jgi:condensin complex subunit 3